MSDGRSTEILNVLTTLRVDGTGMRTELMARMDREQVMSMTKPLRQMEDRISGLDDRQP